MDWLERINSAMNYIETHLTEELDFSQIAKRACCSTFHFTRMFAFITDISLSEYIRRRRLTLAAFELQDSVTRVIDVAAKYGYDSPEAFSRAFKLMHGASPTAARKTGMSLKAYPRLSFHISIKGDIEMNYRIEEKAAFEMAGIATEISAIDGRNYVDIPQFWKKCKEDGTVDRIHRDFGIGEETCIHACLYNFREGAFSYMLCYQPPESGLPDGYAKIRVPAQTWAVFSTGECTEADGTEKIQAIWNRIYPEWFPTSGYEHADAPEFEMYYTLGNGKYDQEVWIPIIKK